jgi:hypothetical protein
MCSRALWTRLKHAITEGETRTSSSSYLHARFRAVSSGHNHVINSVELPRTVLMSSCGLWMLIPAVVVSYTISYLPSNRLTSVDVPPTSNLSTVKERQTVNTHAARQRSGHCRSQIRHLPDDG